MSSKNGSFFKPRENVPISKPVLQFSKTERALTREREKKKSAELEEDDYEEIEKELNTIEKVQEEEVRRKTTLFGLGEKSFLVLQQQILAKVEEEKKAELHAIEQEKWYHNLTAIEANTLLDGTPIGTFLIRPSSQNECFAASFRTAQGINKALIAKVDGGFQIQSDTVDGTIYSSLQELVKNYEAKGVFTYPFAPNLIGVQETQTKHQPPQTQPPPSPQMQIQPPPSPQMQTQTPPPPQPQPQPEPLKSSQPQQDPTKNIPPSNSAQNDKKHFPLTEASSHPLSPDYVDNSRKVTKTPSNEDSLVWNNSFSRSGDKRGSAIFKIGERSQTENSPYHPRTRSIAQSRAEPMNTDDAGNENFLVIFNIPVGDLQIFEFFSSDLTCNQIKAAILAKAAEKFQIPENSLGLIENLVLKVLGVDHYVTSNAPLRRNPFIQICKKAFVQPSFEIVDILTMKESNDLNMKEHIVSELNLLKEITCLVGDNLKTILASQDIAISNCRGRYAMLRIQENLTRKRRTEEGKSQDFNSLIYLGAEPLPSPLPNKIQVTCYLPGNMKKLVDFTLETTVAEARTLIFKKWAMSDKTRTENKNPNLYCIKVRGYLDYLLGDNNKIIDFDYIRNCLNKKLLIELSFVEKASVAEQAPESDISIFDQILAENYKREIAADQAYPRSTYSLTSHFRVQIIGIENLNLHKYEDVKANCFVYVMAELYHGDQRIADPVFTNTIPYTEHLHWGGINGLDLEFGICIGDLPRATRISFSLYVTETNPKAITAVGPKDVPVGWLNQTVFDHKSYLRTDKYGWNVWDGGPANPIANCVENLSDKSPTRLFIGFINPSIKQAVKFPDIFPEVKLSSQVTKGYTIQIQNLLDEIISKDPLQTLTEAEKQMIWEYRYELKSNPKALVKFLTAVSWNNSLHVNEAHQMLKIWTPLEPLDAFELLDAQYADPKVRAYAVECLNNLTDGELSTFLLQLTQVLKYEPYHDSALAEFLLRRALQNRNRIGFYFFWLLKAEVHIPEVSEKFSLLLETYLRGCGKQHREELMKQNSVLDALKFVAAKVKLAPDQERTSVLLQELSKIHFPSQFLLPLDPRVQVRGILLKKCKYMDSKKLPLWVVFENAELTADPIHVIFKSGDDLRQDVLTLQMIRLMDRFWKEQGGLDLRLLPYKVMATGDQVGLIEVVLNSETTANINKQLGGALSVWKQETLTKWLKAENPSEKAWPEIVNRFALSCAGYCVATYILGIGDRHNDNIMVTRAGNLFHIDFGHFLGNFKSKLGIKRERAPFIFTPQFAHVMGSKGSETYKIFEQTCAAAYNIIRKQARLFIVLFQMMLSTGIPELQKKEDIYYLLDAFSLNLTDEEASKKIMDLIQVALSTTTVLINDMVHVIVHNK